MDALNLSVETKKGTPQEYLFLDNYGVPEGTRTPDLLFRRQSLYPLSYRHITAYNNGGFWRLCQD